MLRAHLTGIILSETIINILVNSSTSWVGFDLAGNWAAWKFLVRFSERFTGADLQIGSALLCFSIYYLAEYTAIHKY